MRGQVLFAVSALAIMAFAQPAAAQQYRTYHDEHVATQQCQQSRQNRTVGGAVIGGILGAVLGHNVAESRGSRDEGRALGAVVGAVAGGALGRNSANCDTQVRGSYDQYYGQAQDPYYAGRSDNDYYGGPYQESGYYGRDDDYNRRNCQPSVVERRDRYGRRYQEEILMCRGPDGRWYQEG
jgi:hypothetical protein